MEKYSQYRDRGSGIAPFFPINSQPAGIYLPLYLSLFCIRITILTTVAFSYFAFLQWLPVGSLGRKASLWLFLGVPGIWWDDLQIDGVKKGSLAKHHKARLPQPTSIIASSSTSPIDALYLAAIFDPIFAASYPSTRLVQRVSLLQAMFRAFQFPQCEPPPNTRLIDLQSLVRENPKRVIAVFPECTTTNGRGVLPFSHSLLTAPPTSKIFPVSLRYTPADITTPVPGAYLSFLWNLNSRPTHCIRVRIAESVHNTSQPQAQKGVYGSEFARDDAASSTDTLLESDERDNISATEKRVLDRIAEALARLGRSQRVGLGVKDKIGFIQMWSKHHR